MVSLWQAHLSFVLLGFVALCALRFTQPWRPWLLPVLVALSFIPVNELPLAAYVRSFTDDLAISTLVLLGWVALSRLGLVQPLARPHRVQLLLLFCVLGVALYPATMGLTYVDPYRWGFNPRPMIVWVAARRSHQRTAVACRAWTALWAGGGAQLRRRRRLPCPSLSVTLAMSRWRATWLAPRCRRGPYSCRWKPFLRY